MADEEIKNEGGGLVAAQRSSGNPVPLSSAEVKEGTSTPLKKEATKPIKKTVTKKK